MSDVILSCHAIWCAWHSHIYMWPKIAYDWSYLPKKIKFRGSGFSDAVEDHCWITFIV